MKTTLYIVRHAHSTANVNEMFAGTQDVDLTETGQKQANELCERLKKIGKCKIYSSPLQRAVKTIKPTAEFFGEEINIVPDLIEMNFGDWENYTKSELVKRYPEINKFIDETYYYKGIPNQETTEAVFERMNNALKDIAIKNAGKKVIVVSHGVAIRTFLTKILNIPYEKTKEKFGHIQNTALCVVEYDTKKEEFIVKKLNILK